MKKSSRIVIILLAAIGLSSCAKQTATPSLWSSAERWYQSDMAYDTAKIDVLYLVSTEVLSATDTLGQETWQSQLIAADKAAMQGEIAWVEQNMFYDDYNIFAPYYHEFTFDAIIRLGSEQFDSVYQQVAAEVCDAVDYYMEHDNHGRRFVVAGFSQGAMLALDVLRHLTDEQYERMIACYMIGYRLTEADLQHPHIRAAAGESDYGVVISFNSTQTVEAIWPFVSEGAATCINPVNWRTDAVPAIFMFDSTQVEAHIDTVHHVLIDSTNAPSYYQAFYDQCPFFLQAGVSRDNLHHWDLLFYASSIHDNALRRAGRCVKEE